MNWLASLPHQIPFRAASAVTRIDDRTIVGKYLCTADDPLGPQLDIMLLEAMAQFAGGLAFHETKGHGYLTGIDRCEVSRRIVPGDLVMITVQLEMEFGGLFRFSGSGTIDGVECIRGRFYLAAPPSEAVQTEETGGSIAST